MVVAKAEGWEIRERDQILRGERDFRKRKREQRRRMEENKKVNNVLDELQ